MEWERACLLLQCLIELISWQNWANTTLWGSHIVGSNVQVYAVINLIALRFLFKIINLSNGNLLMISMEGAGKPNAQIQVPVCVMRINGT